MRKPEHKSPPISLTTTIHDCTALLGILPPRTNWKVVKNKYSKNETTNLKQHEKQENKNGGRKSTFLPSSNEPRKGKLSTH